jgi:hypothetical protein
VIKVIFTVYFNMDQHPTPQQPYIKFNLNQLEVWEVRRAHK